MIPSYVFSVASLILLKVIWRCPKPDWLLIKAASCLENRTSNPNLTNVFSHMSLRSIGIELSSVSDQTDEAVFVAFDMEMAKLTNIQAAESTHILGVGANAHVNNKLPELIADIVGKTFVFQLKLVEFNFTSKHQTFTISSINSERQDSPLPEFNNIHEHYWILNREVTMVLMMICLERIQLHI
ncbi:unnamed protein product [Eruca vesicaria subsp. sativa]|uniref:Uncharacterized protein n=1 Tax=Eruca vesicaria subsp. sativa TaxID=29727 RepID=A0ABC8LXL5_ERUVS|nr:unnamed protein product [Eruca vesicaria subsp. sativa]